MQEKPSPFFLSQQPSSKLDTLFAPLPIILPSYFPHICLPCHFYLLFTYLTYPLRSQLFNSLGWSSRSVFFSIKNPCRGTKTDSVQDIKKRNNCSGWFMIEYFLCLYLSTGSSLSRISVLSLVPFPPLLSYFSSPFISSPFITSLYHICTLHLFHALCPFLILFMSYNLNSRRSG